MTVQLDESKLAAGPGDAPALSSEHLDRLAALIAVVPLPTGDLQKRLIELAEFHLGTCPELAAVLAFAANSIAQSVSQQRELDLAYRRRFGVPGTPKRLLAAIAGTVEA